MDEFAEVIEIPVAIETLPETRRVVSGQLTVKLLVTRSVVLAIQQGAVKVDAPAANPWRANSTATRRAAKYILVERESQ